MDKFRLEELLRGVKDGSVPMEEALLILKEAPFDDLGFAKVDTHRQIRQGVTEVIYGAGKTPEQIVAIANNIRTHADSHVLITRITVETAACIQKELPITYDAVSRIGVLRGTDIPVLGRGIVVATGGTSDMPVAEEAALTAELLGNSVKRIYDVGVAGLHRTLSHLDDFMNAGAVVAVAGMEGALASVLGGLCECPVIAVPTSVGYGASFNGLAALLSMLNSCASGVAVVNIDNGFGAGYYASLINRSGGKT